jgi:hypothetical protein
MVGSPYTLGTTTKPANAGTPPTVQQFFTSNCTTPVTYVFLNEFISNFNNGLNYLGLPILPNDDFALKKMIENVLTGKNSFSVTDVNFYNKSGNDALASFYNISNQIMLRIGYSEDGEFAYIAKRDGTSNTNLMSFYDDKTVLSKTLNVNTIDSTSNEFSLAVGGVVLKDGGLQISSSNSIKTNQNLNIDIDIDETSNIAEFAVRDTVGGVPLRRFIVNDDGTIEIRKIDGSLSLYIIDEDAINPTAANPYMAFGYASVKDAPPTRSGYIGYGSTSDTDLTIRNDVGDVEFSASTGIYKFVNGAVTADNFDGKWNNYQPSYFTNSSNQNAGTLPKQRLPAVIDSDTTGNAQSATQLVTPNGTITDFKEGTFTPNINCFSSAVVAEGRYQKIQNVVNLSIYFELNDANRTGTGSSLIRISNVPYLSGVLTQKSSLLNLYVESGFYAFENQIGAIHAVVDASNNVLNFIYHNEFERSPMTIAQLANWTGVKKIRISGQLFLF